VKNLVLPAAEEAVSIWINKFGFSRMRPEQVYIFLTTYNSGARLTFCHFIPAFIFTRLWLET
jgi:hypothetical protein